MPAADRADKVLIAGGGIGGLCAALSLARQGFEVEVLERAAKFGEIGAGIQLGPNCTRVLFDLGLEEALGDLSFRPQGSEIRHWKSGRVITSSPLGDSVQQRYGYPYLHIHRADLLDLLVDSVGDEPGITLHRASEVTGITRGGTGVSVTTRAGKHFEADLLVGADGIHSVVREHLFGREKPTFTGNIAWRALVPSGRLPAGLVRSMATLWWGPGAHFVHYYVRRGELVNWVCVKEKKGWEIESWQERGDYRELKQDFKGWHSDLQLLIDNADRDSLYKWALFDRPPMPVWGRGRITLLGDACHPTLPFMAQGAAMAIEDGAVLARCLSGAASYEESLGAYGSLRRSRTADVQRGSRRNGRVFHLRGPGAWLRDRVAPRAQSNAEDWLFRYDALTAHERPGKKAGTPL